MLQHIKDYSSRCNNIDTITEIGTVQRVRGQLIEGIGFTASVGDQCSIITSSNKDIDVEVVGFSDRLQQLLSFEEVTGIAIGDKIISRSRGSHVIGGQELLGRVIDSRGRVLDDGPPIASSETISLHRQLNHPLKLKIENTQFRTGIKVLDAFVPVAIGQKMGIFSGSGVGKTVLLGMLARHSSAQINVIALIGERGREVNDFIHDYLGTELMSRSIVIVSTSESTPLARVRGAYTAVAIADYFRKHGNHVLLLFDSMTRFARAQREIGLAAGEPPTTRGYPPSVYALMPRLIECCGSYATGSITGIFTVLVEGDDLEEPISDALRGLLDGHVVLSRKIAQRAIFPAVDILHSVSRLEHKISDSELARWATQLRKVLSEFFDLEELINIGAYQKGTNDELDHIIAAVPMIDAFITQDMYQSVAMDDVRKEMRKIITMAQGDH